MGAPVLPTEDDVKELARIFTGWTFGDGNPGHDSDAAAARENYRVPMEAVARYHDTGAKTFLGETFAADIRRHAQDLDQALDVIFNHPNVGAVRQPAADSAAGDVEPEPGVHRATSRRCSTTTARAIAATWRPWCARS